METITHPSIDALLTWPCTLAAMERGKTDQAIQYCLKQGCRVIGADTGFLARSYKRSIHVEEVHGGSGSIHVNDQWLVDETPFREVFDTPRSQCIESVEAHPVMAQLPLIQRLDMKGMMVWPLQVDHETYGCLCFYSSQPLKGVSPGMIQIGELAAHALARHLEFDRSRSLQNLLNQQLKEALEDVKALHGLLPICASCKKIRDMDGLWVKFEEYVAKHSLAQLSHGLCKPCVKELYGFDPDEVELDECQCGN